MVKSWMKMIGREIRGLHEAAYLLGLFALISLVLALVRDKLLAYSFGAGHVLDVYYAAFRIPDLIFVSVGSLVSASILLPYFIEKFGESKEAGRSFTNGIFTVFFCIIVLISAICFIAAPKLVPLVLPGFANDGDLPKLIMAMRIMLLSPFFLGLSNLFSSLTQMRHRFLVYAASPVMYNAGIIVGVLFGYKYFGIPGLAWGVALGALLHVAIQVPFIGHEGLLPTFATNIDWKSARRIFLTSLPRTITLSANQISSFVLISLASLMPSGSISVFSFAFNLQSVPLTLIGASYSSAVFPTLSKLYYEKNTKEFLEKMISAARHIIFWSMPLMVMFIVLRAQIVRLILGAGKFDWADTRLTAAALALFIISVVGQSLIILFIRAFYAEGKTSKPFIFNVISAGITIAIAFILWKIYYTIPFLHYFLEDLFKTGAQVAGSSVLLLSLAYTVGVTVNTLLHWFSFTRSHKGFTRPVLSTVFHSFAASVIMGYATYLSLRIFSSFFPLNKVWGLFMQGFLSALVGLIVLILVLRILENKELAEVWSVFHRKVWKSTVPPAEVEHI